MYKAATFILNLAPDNVFFHEISSSDNLLYIKDGRDYTIEIWKRHSEVGWHSLWHLWWYKDGSWFNRPDFCHGNTLCICFVKKNLPCQKLPSGSRIPGRFIRWAFSPHKQVCSISIPSAFPRCHYNATQLSVKLAPLSIFAKDAARMSVLQFTRAGKPRMKRIPSGSVRFQVQGSKWNTPTFFCFKHRWAV